MTILGIRDGVEVYSNLEKNYAENNCAENNYWNGIYTGLKYQCVELARRYLIINYGITFDCVDYAYQIFDLNHFTHIENKEQIPIVKCKNKESSISPKKGSLIIWAPEGEMEITGHVAVVVNDNYNNNCIEIIEQNISNEKWIGKNYSRKLKLEYKNNCYNIFCDLSKIIGWINF